MQERKFFSIVCLAAALGSLTILNGCKGGDQPPESPVAGEESAAEGTAGREADQKPAEQRSLLARVFSRPVVKTVPAGTTVSVELLETLGSKTSAPGDTFRARVTAPVVVNREVVIPAGSNVTGTVAEAVPLKKIGGRPRLRLRFTSVEPPSGDESSIRASYFVQGKSETKKDVATIGGVTAGGALLGRVIGHEKGEEARGTAVGAAVGAAAGTVIAASTKGQEVVLTAGRVIQIRLDEQAQITTKS